MGLKRVQLPLERQTIFELEAGQGLLLNGPLLSGRDAAHKRLVATLKAGAELPISFKGETIYYVGPCPTPPGRVIGSAGPTTSGRMDVYTPLLLEQGLVGMIGKGERSPEVIAAMGHFGAVYLAALGGAGALISQAIVKAEILAYHDLGPEAIYRLVVRDLPVIVAIDIRGNDLYQLGRQKYAGNA